MSRTIAESVELTMPFPGQAARVYPDHARKRRSL